MADINDFFTSTENAGAPEPTTAAEERVSGGSTLSCESITNWPTTGAEDADSAVFFITAPTTTNSAGLTVLDETKLMGWKGIVSGNTITNIQLTFSATGEDIGNAIGDIVQMAPTSTWAQSLYEGLIVSHNNDGTLKDEIVETSKLDANLQGGWFDPSGAWSFSSYDSTHKTGVITVPSTDPSAIGQKVKFTNNSATQFGIITGSTSTTRTIYFGTDYSLTNSAITANFYSPHKAPSGFPLDTAKWTVRITSANDRAISGTSFATLTDAITVPIGSWRLSMKVSIWCDITSTSTRQGYVTLSSNASTETNPDITAAAQFQGSSAATALADGSLATTNDDVSVTTATTFTLMGKISATAGTAFSVFGSTVTPTVLKAVCAYL